MSLDVALGGGMSLPEVLALTERLLTDQTSHVGAAHAGWPHPWPLEANVLADVYDLLAITGRVKNPKPYSRPWHKAKARRRGTPTATRLQVRAMLEAMRDGTATPGRPLAAGPAKAPRKDV